MTPKAARIGTIISATIHEEWITVSHSFARYSRSQSTGAETRRSRSLARKKLDSAVMTLERMRIDTNASSTSPSSFPASSGPSSSTPRKYLRIRNNTP